MKPTEYAPGRSPAAPVDSSWLNRRCLQAILKRLPHFDCGVLDLYLPDGRHLRFGEFHEDQPHAEVRLHRYRSVRRLLRGGLIGWAESYMDGEWDSPDLCGLVRWALENETAMRDFMKGHPLLQLFNRLLHLRRNNSRSGSRRNIEYHYDLGNAFYRLWLDRTMTYSAALFDTESSLEAAQLNKYRRICKMLNLQPGQHVLEIGCGWGGFAEVAAAEFGACVDGVTLSSEQLAFARRRAHERGLDALCQFSLTDYRDLDRQYDHIVSIEMFEAVGESHWPEYFETLKRCLRPDGKAVLQIISIADERFENYRRGADFIQRYIFPGGMLPSPRVLAQAIKQGDLRLTDSLLFGEDYARTLAIWHRSFTAHWPEIQSLGFDERFRRMWSYYLGYCEGGFREGTIDVGLYCIEHQ